MRQPATSDRNARQRFGSTRILKPYRRISCAIWVAVGLAALFAKPIGAVDTIDMDHAPVFLLSGVAPNLILTLDDSSSMAAAHSKDTGATPELTPRDTAALANTTYYDPSIVYLPPLDAAGHSFGNADFNAAPRDFFRNEVAPGADVQCSLDLASGYAPLWKQESAPCTEVADGSLEAENLYSVDPGHPLFVSYRQYLLDNGIYTDIAAATGWAKYCLYGDALPAGISSGQACPAFYYVWNPNNQHGGESCGPQPQDPEDIPLDCLERVVVGSNDEVSLTESLYPGIHEKRDQGLRTQQDGDVELNATYMATLAKRNFANWYSYYRTRWLTLQTTITRVLVTLDPAVRVAYQRLIRGSVGDLSEIDATFGSFDASKRQAFQDWLFDRLPLAVSTPLLSSALRVEKFCESDLAYLQDPTMALGASLGGGRTNQVLACRNNFHLIFTDGIWDDSFGAGENSIHPESDAPWLGNNDGTDTSLPMDRQYAAGFSPPVSGYDAGAAETRIFADSNSAGLADVVFHSWITDLRPNENGDDQRVPTLIWDPVIPDGEDESYVFWNPANDPADWQHITTYAVGLGVAGEVIYPDGTYDNDKNIATDGFPGNWDAINGVAVQPAPDNPPWWCVYLPWHPLCQGGGQGEQTPLPTGDQKIDDLWHAGINGRGGYSSAKNPESLIESFQEMMDAVSAVAKQSASAVTPTFNSGSAGTTRMVFQASLNSSDWTGDLKAFRISGGPSLEPCPELDVPKGELCEDPAQGRYFWSAAEGLDDPSFFWSTRKVASATASDDGGTRSQTGVSFDSGHWDSYTDEDKRALLDIGESDSIPAADAPEVQKLLAVIDYLVGRRDYEAALRAPTDPYTFRDRASLLGDIIRAGPVVVAAPNRIFNDTGYQSYQTANANRTEIVYAGANDGMLHAFDVANGQELFAYVPRPVFRKLARLADPAYGSGVQHDNFVDGPIVEGDAYFAGAGTWNPVVVGALGLGAQGVYAIRSPSLGGGATLDASRIHLWDFTDVDDPDMGYVLGKPSVVRVLMSDGTIRWVAVFGNGYNSSEDDAAVGGRRADGCEPVHGDGALDCGRAVLYVVDIETGELVAKFDTLAGRSSDPNHDEDADKEPNGLAEPKVIGRVLTNDDGDVIGGGDPIATVAYAGDLFGNLWRFDLYELSASSTQGEEPDLVFQAVNGEGVAQSITSGVEVVSHPTGVGAIVLFGTGRYFGISDVTDTSVQSFYGIWDKGVAGERTVPLVTRADLLPQQLEKTDLQAAGVNSGRTLGRTSSRNTIDWNIHQGWMLDLIETDNHLKKGERVIYAPAVHVDRVVFVTVIPETNPCTQGGISWVNAVAYNSGSALDETPFDYDLNGLFDTEDKLEDPDADTAVAGTSIRMTEETGVYSGPSSLALQGGVTKTVVSSSEGDLIELLESSLLQWRVWRQLQ